MGALCLTRHEGEKILVGEDIVIEVVRIERSRVALVIHAPPETSIDREEVRQSKNALKERRW